MRTFFFFNDTATTEIYTLSLHDALPISGEGREPALFIPVGEALVDEDDRRFDGEAVHRGQDETDRKSTRLNSSHAHISYAVFCLKKKNIPTAISRATLPTLLSLHAICRA